MCSVRLLVHVQTPLGTLVLRFSRLVICLESLLIVIGAARIVRVIKIKFIVFGGEYAGCCIQGITSDSRYVLRIIFCTTVVIIRNISEDNIMSNINRNYLYISIVRGNCIDCLSLFVN